MTAVTPDHFGSCTENYSLELNTPKCGNQGPTSAAAEHSHCVDLPHTGRLQGFAALFNCVARPDVRYIDSGADKGVAVGQ